MLGEQPGTKEQGTPHQRPIHVLELGLRWPPETFLSAKMEGLATRGFEVTVAAYARRSTAGTPAGVRWIRLPDPSRPRVVRALGGASQAMRLLRRDRRQFAALVEAIARDTLGGRRSLLRLLDGFSAYGRLAALDADIVHCEWEAAAVYHRPAIDVLDCPLVVSCHGSGINVHPASQPAARHVTDLPEVFGRAVAVHCVSRGLLDAAVKLGLDRAKARVIPSAVDTAFFCPDASSAAAGAPPLRIVSVGKLTWIKGYEYAVEAIARLAALGSGVEAEILGGEPDPRAGTPSDRERILRTIEAHELSGCIRLVGEVGSAEVRDALRRADVLLHASVSEGIPTVVLEAMACGVPVVTTDCGGVREAVRDGVDGIIVPIRDTAALAEALATLWADPGRRQRMGRSGRERVLTSFTLERQLDAYQQLYEDVVAATRAGRAGQLAGTPATASSASTRSR